ncbi:DUF6350 family protein [Jatrophihabitans telluris]|uniref:DUF6350 family protein n=1 Tax=Jatrophihabitans telluris TaxID=2038343 RepID=A0ABY4QY86_9ACTN|nr:DUF6350 family protein [Jatrophihabitans telluris]UQX87849.1 DUF6350 family protein [Jatrophihabitans telluris]
MTRPDPDYPPGWLTRFRRGVVAGVALFLLAVLLTAIPTFLAWFAPGADSTAASSALKAAAILTISGNHGGLVLEGVHVSLTPLLVTGLLGWLVGWHARRPETVDGFIGLVLGYSAATAVAADWAVLGQSRAPLVASLIAALGFSAGVGSAARYGPLVWSRLDARVRAVLRAGAAAAGTYFALGAALVAVSLVAHLHEATTVQGRLAVGVGGLPIALLGVGAAPNLVLGGVGFLAGPGFAVGSHTAVSPFGASHGKLPLFPALAAVPLGRPALAVGVGLMILTALAAGALAVRALGRAGSLTAQLLDVLLASVTCGAIVALASALATGGLGSGALQHIGTVWWLLGASVAGLVLASGGAIATLLQLVHRRGAGDRRDGDSAQTERSGDDGGLTERPGAGAEDAMVGTGTGRVRGLRETG